jgi:hypothetical protein
VIREQSAQDRCVYCGHVRADHDGPDGCCEGRDENRGGFPALVACDCSRFREDEPAQ